MYDSRRTSYSSSRSASTVSTSSMSSEAGSRKQSLREMPSYRVEASKALNRRDDLKDLKKRLSSNRDLLNADHASKPWLKFRSISQKSFEDVKEESGQAYVVDEPNYDSLAPLPPPRKSKISSSASDPAAILSPSAVMSARPRASKYSRTNNEDFYMYNY